MRRTIALWSIVALCLLLIAVAPSSLGAAKDTPLEYGKEYTISGAATQRWYIDVNLGDNITVNVSEVVSYYAYVNIDPDLRYSSSSDDSLMDASGTTRTGLLSPFTFWFVCAHSQLIWLEFQTQVYYTSPSMTYNITRVNGTISQMPDYIARLNQDVSDLNDSLLALNSTMANLISDFLANLSIVNNYTAYLNASIGEMNTSMLALINELNAAIDGVHADLWTQLQNITDLWGNITSLSSGLFDQGTQEVADINYLKGQLAALNTSLAEADASLLALVEMNDTLLKSLLGANNGSLSNSILGLSDQLSALRGEVQNISFPLPEQYNDTLLWREIARLNATPPVTVVEVNNTTIVNKTEVSPTTFVNRTETLSTGGNGVLAGAIAGVVSGSIAGGGGLVYFERRLKKRFGGMVSLPESMK
jgi:hypothetical protein